jgi:hypothetical protein
MEPSAEQAGRLNEIEALRGAARQARADSERLRREAFKQDDENAARHGLDRVVHVECPECATRVLVFPALLIKVLPAIARRRVVVTIAGLSSDRGERFTIADARGAFSCPDCGRVFAV